MEHYGRDLTFVLFVLTVFGGLVAYGFRVGMLPSRSGPLKRSENPVAFYIGLFVYACIALVALYGTVNVIFLMCHRTAF